jgi:4-phosphopantoate--beta-alanine ligase
MKSMSLIPLSHPRAKSLQIREMLVYGFDQGLVAKEGLMAHGRGETFDYLLGEKTSNSAKKAINAAAITLLSASYPVISVNGNIAALCPKEIVQLSRVIKAKIEVNLFYASEKRKKNIVKILKKYGAKEVLGINRKAARRLSGLDSARRFVDKDGIYQADIKVTKNLSKKKHIQMNKFDNKKNLAHSVLEIKKHLTRRLANA